MRESEWGSLLGTSDLDTPPCLPLATLSSPEVELPGEARHRGGVDTQTVERPLEHREGRAPKPPRLLFLGVCFILSYVELTSSTWEGKQSERSSEGRGSPVTALAERRVVVRTAGARASTALASPGLRPLHKLSLCRQSSVSASHGPAQAYPAGLCVAMNAAPPLTCPSDLGL